MFASFFDFALAVYCMYVCTYNGMCNVYVLFTYIGPGRIEIVGVKVFIEEERSLMKVTLMKVTLLL